MTEPENDRTEPEYLGSMPVPSGPDDARGGAGRSRRSAVVVGAVALGVVGAAAAGWAASRLLGDEDDPATAIPAIALGYVAVDLDPSAAQKIEALRMAKQFPALSEHLDLGVRDDIRQWLFDERFADVGCGLEYDADVAPWIGNRLAVAAVPEPDGAAPIAVLAVEDQAAAEKTVRDVEECVRAGEDSIGGGAGDTSREPVGLAFVGGYLLVAETQADADSLATAAEAAPLAEDPAYTGWMQELGEPGILTMYASSEAPKALTRAGADYGLPGMVPPGYPDEVRALWADFDGMAAAVRFADGALEVESVGRGMPRGVLRDDGGDGAPSLGALPASTAVAFTVPLAEGWSADLSDVLVPMFSAGESENEFWDQQEQGTGLQLPEDLETLLGTGFSVSVDASLSVDELTSSDDVPRLPVALRIAGDPDEVVPVLNKLLAIGGPMAQNAVTIASGDGLVVVGLDPAYVERVRTETGLADLPAFQRAVPDADAAEAGLYVGFDAAGPGGSGWLDGLAAEEPEAKANLAPLEAMGVSGHTDGDVQRSLMRLTLE